MMAYGSLVSGVAFNCGIKTFLQVLIPSSVMFGTLLTLLLYLPYIIEQSNATKDCNDKRTAENKEK